MNIILVAYRWNSAKSRALDQWIRALPPADEVIVIENAPDGTLPASNYHIVRGSNIFAEFSGYSEALKKLRRPDQPCLILNDTALAHHTRILWCLQIRHWIQWNRTGIFGDPRKEQLVTEFGQLTYYASWIFWLPSAQSLQVFSDGLDHVMAHWDLRFSANSGYRNFLNRYLKGSIFHGWKNAGLKDQKATDLKIRCIWAEHRLSEFIQRDYPLQPLNIFGSAALRLLDRGYSFRRRTQSFL